MPAITRIFWCLLCCLAVIGCAPKPWGTAWDKALDQDDVEVEYRTAKNGAKTREITLPSGVHVVETKDKDGKVTSHATDEKNGAVLCFREMLIALRNELGRCYPKTREDDRARVEQALGSVHDFIAANSLEPVTVSALRDDMQQKYWNYETCKPVFLGYGSTPPFLADIEGLTRKMLSVPRPPVMDPCA